MNKSEDHIKVSIDIILLLLTAGEKISEPAGGGVPAERGCAAVCNSSGRGEVRRV
jgi:hypothetical protein